MKCLITRWLVSQSFDSRNGIPFFAQKHLMQCEKCRRWRDSQVQINAGLADVESTPAHMPELEQKIITGLSSIQEQTPSESRRDPAFAVMAVVAATLLLMFVFLWPAGRNENIKGGMPDNKKEHETSSTIDGETGINHLPADGGIEQIQTMLTEMLFLKPSGSMPGAYMNEFNLLMEDARNALDTATKCLPLELNG